MTTNSYFFLPELLLFGVAGLFPGLLVMGVVVPVLLFGDGLLELLLPGTLLVLGVLGFCGLPCG
jgi:hypothetical protein